MSQDGQYIHDFNLDFLETICGTTGNNYDKIDRQKNSVLLTKKKIIATSDLLKKYYEKKNALHQAEKSLQESRLECKQVCLDKKSAQEKVAILEEREKNLVKKSREWEERYLQATNQYEAMKSHANQLQLLVDQSEEKLEEKQLKHDVEIEKYKDFHKNNQISYKERKLLHRHIYILKDIVLGRKKLTKAARNLLEKYKFPENDNDKDIEDYNWIEDDILDEEDTDFIVADNKENLKLVQIKDDDLLLPDDNGLHSPESDCNEITSSVDTGFGTLISTSDSEKCLKSPDYFSGDSPIPTENSKKSSVTIKKADTATSPIKLLFTRDVATSPIPFEKVSVEISVPVTSPSNPKKPKRSLFDEASEDEFEYDNYTEISTNAETKYPIKIMENEQQQKIQKEQTKRRDHNDEEVELIINTMKRKFDMLLPLPPSPNPPTQYVQVESHSCEEAAKIRKDNEIMKSTIASLAKEVCEIKSLLQAQKPVDANNVTLNSHSNVTAEFVPDPVTSNKQSHEKETKQSDCFLINENPVIKVTEIIEFENDECNSIDTNENCDIPDNSELTKIVKKRKLSKLEKMRANLAPKSKIKPVGILSKTITKRLRQISKHSSVTISTPNKLETSKSLNDKAAYEKAVAVMKARNNKDFKRDIIKTRLQKKSVSEPDKCLEKCPDVACQNTAENSCATDEKPFEITSNSINNSLESVTDALRQDSNVIKSPTESNIFVSPRTTRSKLKEIERNIKIAETQTQFDQKDNATKAERKLKRPSIEEPNIRPKRILRSNSSSVSNDNVENVNGDKNLTPQPHTELSVTTSISNNAPSTIADDKNNENRDNSPVATHKEIITTSAEINKKATCYSDLDLFYDKDDPEQVEKNCNGTETSSPSILYPTITQPGDSILCKMIKKYGIAKFKQSPKITETINEKICKTIEDGVERISHLAPTKVNEAMNELVDELKVFKYKQVLSGLIAYFRKPERKTDLFNKTTIPPVPPMSKNEQILLYVIGKLKDFWPGVDIVDELLRNIEYALFRLNNTPELDTIEVMSHFYAVVCRYIRAKSRLRMFMLDAMYCLSFKAIPVVRQSLEVWMHVLPLAHMAAARIPLVICVIYLLHFFKCLDYGNKVYELRNILQKKYSYKITEWNEKELLEMFRNAIMELRDMPIEKKMLRIALIILSKRQGPRWCEKNVIQGLLLPIIDKQEVPERIRQFCVLMLGPLMRPFPNDMKVHCEIGLNKLFDMRENNLSANMEEAVFTSLVYMVKHDQSRVNRALLTWQPQTISEDLEKVLCEYIKEKPIKTWKNLLGKVYRCDN